MTSTPSPAGELTAHRRRHGKTLKVVVELDGQVIDELGGKRAERAEAALVTRWPQHDRAGVAGLRQDLDAARKEAARLETAATMTTRPRFGGRGATIPVNRPDWARAVPVVDELEQVDR